MHAVAPPPHPCLNLLPGCCSGAPSPPFVSWLVTTRLVEPMQQCLAINAWLAVVVGAALPFFILRWLEGRMRKAQQQQQQGPEQQQPGQQSQATGASQAGEALDCPRLSADPLQFMLISSTVWVMACGLQAARLQ